MTRKNQTNFKINTMVLEKAEVQILTNVKNVFKIHSISDQHDGSDEKVSFSLICDPELTENKPFLAVHLHGDSENIKQRVKERENITKYISKIITQLKEELNIEIKDYVVMGDFNENILKSKSELDEEKLIPIIQSLGEGASFQDISIPTGIMEKERGSLDGRPYNLYINPQIKKDKKKEKLDSKVFVLRYKITAIDSQKEESNIKAILAKKARQLKKKPLPTKNFVKTYTAFRDHFGAEPMKIGKVVLNVNSYLPTIGEKAIKSPTEVYKNLPKTRADLEKLWTKQEESTAKLFKIIATKINVDLTCIKLNSFDEIQATITLLTTMCAEVPRELLKAMLVDIVTEWMNSKEYASAQENLNDDYKVNVQTKMLELTNSVIQEKIIDKLSEVSPISKLIQLCGQRQKQEMSGGYSLINNHPYPGPYKIDEAHAKSSVNEIHLQDGDYHYYSCHTEAGKKNKGNYFEKKLKAVIITSPFKDWDDELSNYLTTRNRKYAIKDVFFSDDKKKRSQQVTRLKELLEKYKKLLYSRAIDEPDLAEDEDEDLTENGSFKNFALIDALPKAAKEDLRQAHSAIQNHMFKMKKDFKGRNLESLLNKISMQLEAHSEHSEIDDSTNADLSKDFFATKTELYDKARDNLQACIDCSGRSTPFNNWLKVAFSKVQTLANYGNTLPSDKKEACLEVATSMVQALTKIYEYQQNQSIISETDLKIFQTHFHNIAHSQDPTMAEHRHYFALIADIMLCVMTAGLVHLFKGAVTKAKTGVAKFGVFVQPTHREKLIKDLDNSIFSISEANAAPAA